MLVIVDIYSVCEMKATRMFFLFDGRQTVRHNEYDNKFAV